MALFLVVAGIAALATFFLGLRLICSKHEDTCIAAGIDIQGNFIFPGQISHTRLQPVSHKFAYSYLMVGVSVRNPCSTWLLSVDETRWTRRGWLQILAADHLERGNNKVGLEHKLDEFIRQQGLDPASFPTVFLVTSPRLLFYKFSPASFWYLYSASNELIAIIAEVNNTFDERRLYFLTDNDIEQTTGKPGQRFKQSWGKDFHVSPFNSRRGTFTLSVQDVQRERADVRGIVNVNATLINSAGRPKLVARMLSTTAAIDVAQVTLLDSIFLILSWWWVGHMTYVRIVREAILLACVRRLGIWSRPEPLPSTIARRPNFSERILAASFIRYLHFMIANMPGSTSIQFEYPLDGRHSITIKNSPCAPTEPCQLSLKVLSPKFFTQALTFTRMSELLESALLNRYIENRSAESSDAKMIVQLFRQLETAHEAIGRSWLRSARMLLVRWARPVSPLEGSYPHPPPGSPQDSAHVDPSHKIHFVPSEQHHSFHFLDDFVLGHDSFRDRLIYTFAAVTALLRARIATVVGGE